MSGSDGLTTSWPSIMPIRTAPTGPRNGSGEIISAAEAPLMARMSCGVIRSAESVVQMTCTSFRSPSARVAGSGESIVRGGEDRLLGRASLALEEAAGDLSGRVHPLLDVDGEREEVRASRASRRAWAVARTIVSPLLTTTAPSACLASLPVSNVISS